MDKRQSALEWIRFTGSILRCRSEFIKANVVLAFMALIFFAKPILLGLVPSASDLLTIWPIFDLGHTQVQNTLLTDVVVESEPWIFFNSLNLQNFQLPLWNPYCAGGVPHFANMFFSVFFFLAWPLYIIGVSKYTLLFFYFGKIYLAGICCYCYLRSIGVKPYPAITGSVAYMFIGFNIVWLYYSPSDLIFILPAMLYLIEKVVASRSNEKYFLALTILTATGLIAGFPVMFFHIAMASFMYLIYKLLSRTPYDAAWVLKRYMLFSALGFALSAVQLVPFLEYLLNSNAWAVRQAGDALDWHTAILNLQPEFYGSPSIYQMVPYYVNFTNYNQSASGYVGIAMICLAVFAVMTKFKDSLVKFYLILSIWAIGVVYGLPGIFDLTVSLPLFSKANNFGLLFLIGFNVVVLGSLGLNQIIDGPKHKEGGRIMRYFSISASLVLATLFCFAWANRSFLYTLSTLNVANFSSEVVLDQTILVLRTTIIVLMLSAFIYIYVRFNDNCKYRTTSLALLFILVFAETGFHGMLFEPAVDEKYFHPKVEAFDWINSRNELYRTTSISSTGSGSVYPVNTQMTYGIYDIRDYDALELKHYWTLLKSFANGRIYGWVDLFDVDKRFLDFMGVRWILTIGNLSEEMDISTVGGNATIGNLSMVEQEFVSRKANLTKIELLFDLQGNNELNSNISIELIETKTKNVVRSTRVNTKRLKTGQWYPFEFYPLNNSLNRKYVLRIKTDAESKKNGITLWKNSKSTISSDSKLYINEVESSGSLCFNTYVKKHNPFELTKIYPTFYLYQNKEAMHRAFIVQEAIFRENDSEILSVLKNSSFNWKKAVVIFGKNNSIQYPKVDTNVSISEYQPTYIKIYAATAQPGFLVLSDTYYPGWNAYINGTKVEVSRANYAFRAIKIDPGTHSIEFKYEPISVYLGGIVSLFSSLVFVKILILGSKKKHR